MRELKRSIARHLMEMHGMTQINKKKHWKPTTTGGRRSTFQQQNDGRMVSFFSLHWKEYIDPKSNFRRSLESGLKRDAIRKSRLYGKPFEAPWPVPRRW